MINFKFLKKVRYNLRSNNDMLMLAKPRTNTKKRNFSYKAAKVWNILPQSLKQVSISVDDFQSKLKMILNNK